MSLIKLKNVSKFYYKKGVIASGFTKVNLSFDIGEFVAITGESGSGKSTLLNVISGLDSYEEGEMYINGSETSHYTEKDFENYRRTYVGNIFQNFNLVNSYTVYQNIELVLLLNGYKKKEIKKKVLDLIKKVGLYKFRNAKVSKLSGGQKQRVAIARALAKDTPMIIADEPTGSLDSSAANEIIKLLSEVAKDKLVIIVTHNYEQVSKYVTRKIRMHDGKVLEDKKIKEIDDDIEVKKGVFNSITPLNKIRLAFRNTFNIIPKFLLLLIVYLFITVSIIAEYASFREQEYIESQSGENYVFQNFSDKRIVIKKKDKSSISDNDYDTLKKIENVDYVVKNDLLIDSFINLTDNNSFWLDGSVNNIENFRGNVDIGRMPENDDEVIIEANKNDYYVKQSDKLLSRDFYIENYYTSQTSEESKVKIVGIKYSESSNNYYYKIYMSDKHLKDLDFQINQNYSKVNYKFQNQNYVSNSYDQNGRISFNSNVPDGYAYMTEENNYICPKENCINEPISINVSNLYYSDKIDLIVLKTYNKKNMNNLLGLNNYDDSNGTIYISVNDYNRLFNKDNYQSSVYVADVKKIDNTLKKLDKLGYNTLALKDTLVTSPGVQMLKIISLVAIIALIIVLFFISYFVIKVILKSRNKYFSTIRILGATKNVSRQLLILELLIVSNLAYFSFISFVYLNALGVFNVNFVYTIINYLEFKDYLILYIVLISMSYLISIKFAKKLFKKSAITTLGEEV